MLVSVNIPTRNSQPIVNACMRAVNDQTYKNIEMIVIDSESTDRTPEIAEKFGAGVINTKWKLLGARYHGVKASRGEYVLLLDSDQILFKDTVDRLLAKMAEGYDMLCLEEEPYATQTFMEKLFVADRKVINGTADLDPMRGVMLPRFYRREILDRAMDNIDIDKLHDVVAHDHAIIYYEAYKLSQKVGVLEKAVRHKEPSTFRELWRKNYRYGQTTQLMIKTRMYPDLLRRKTRFRKGSLNLDYLRSTFLLMLKGIPYTMGMYHAKLASTA